MSYVLFDMGKVLLDFSHGRGCQQAGELCGLDQATVDSAIFDTGLQAQYESGAVSCDEFYQAFCSTTGADVEQAALLDALSDIFELNLAILPVVTQLRQRGVPLGILSNTCKAHWDFISRSNYQIFSSCFQDHLLSFELKSMKPDERIYAESIRHLGREPDEVVFIDDREENVTAAREYGIDAIQYTSQRDLLQELGQRSLLS